MGVQASMCVRRRVWAGVSGGAGVEAQSGGGMGSGRWCEDFKLLKSREGLVTLSPGCVPSLSAPELTTLC